MGMYDIVKCEYELPIKSDQSRIFQTKSLDNNIDFYIINTKGQLIKEIGKNKIDMKYHGNIRFYDYDENTKEWIEYNAIFTHGIIEKLERVKGE